MWAGVLLFGAIGTIGLHRLERLRSVVAEPLRDWLDYGFVGLVVLASLWLVELGIGVWRSSRQLGS